MMIYKIEVHVVSIVFQIVKFWKFDFFEIEQFQKCDDFRN